VVEYVGQNQLTQRVQRKAKAKAKAKAFNAEGAENAEGRRGGDVGVRGVWGGGACENR